MSFLFWCEKQYIVLWTLLHEQTWTATTTIRTKSCSVTTCSKISSANHYSYLLLHPWLHQTTTCSPLHILVIWQLHRWWSEVAMQSSEIDSSHHKIILPWESFKSLCGRGLCFFIARDNLWFRCPIIYSPCMKDFGLFRVWSKEHLHILIFLYKCSVSNSPA